ncbi:homeobox protein 5-like, partial [Penaeus vannamei]|uniref:homeobox protein 5-like n=1 Tax=Penaeus vannamei TaxID=6689 RepID=UPI00387F52EE
MEHWPTFFINRNTEIKEYKRPAHQDLQSNVKNQFGPFFVQPLFENGDSHLNGRSRVPTSSYFPGHFVGEGLQTFAESDFLRPELMQNDQLLSGFQHKGQNEVQLVQQGQSPQYEYTRSHRQQDTHFGHQTVPEKLFQAPPITYLSLWPRQTLEQESLVRNNKLQSQQRDSYDSQNDIFDLETQQSTSSFLLSAIDGPRNLETDHRRRIGLTLDLPMPHSDHNTQQPQQNDFPGKHKFSHTEFHSQQPPNSHDSEFRQKNAFENQFFEQYDHSASRFQEESERSLDHQKNLQHGNQHGTQFQQDSLHNKFKRDSQHIQFQQENVFLSDQIFQQKLTSNNQHSDQNQQLQHAMNNHQFAHDFFPIRSQFQQQTVISNNQFHTEVLSNNHSQQRQLPNNSPFQQDTFTNNNEFQHQNEFSNNRFQQEIPPHNDESQRNPFDNNNSQQDTLPTQNFQEETLPNINDPRHENLEIGHNLNLRQDQPGRQILHNNTSETSTSISQDQVNSSLQVHNHPFTSTTQQKRQLQSVFFHGQPEENIHQTTQSHPHTLQGGLREQRNPQSTQLHPLVVNSRLTDPRNIQNIPLNPTPNVITTSQNHVNNSFQVQDATYTPKFTTEQQIEQLESLILSNGQSESLEYIQSEEQIPQTLHPGSQILQTRRAEQGHLQNTRFDEQTQKSGFRDQRNAQSDSHIQVSGSAGQSQPQHIQSDLVLAIDSANERPQAVIPHTQGGGLREQRNPQTATPNSHMVIGHNDPQRELFIPQNSDPNLGHLSSATTRHQNEESKFLNNFDSQSIGGIHSETTGPLINLHSGSENGDTQVTVSESLHSAQLDFEVSTVAPPNWRNGLTASQGVGNSGLQAQHSQGNFESQNQDEFERIFQRKRESQNIQKNIDSHQTNVENLNLQSQSNSGFQIQNNESFNQDHFNSQKLTDFGLSNQDHSFQTQNFDFHFQNQNNFEAQNLDNLQLQNQKENFRQNIFIPQMNDENLTQNSSVFQIQNLNNVQTQTQNHNNFQFQNENRNNFHTQNENNFQSEHIFQSLNQNHNNQNQNQNAFLNHEFPSQNQNQNILQGQTQLLNNAKLPIRQNNFEDLKRNQDNLQLQIQSHNEFQAQNLNLNNAQLQIRPQNNFQSHEHQNNFPNLNGNQDNFQIQIQNHNTFPIQPLIQNNFPQNQAGKQNNFQNQNLTLNIFKSQIQNQNNFTQNQNHNSPSLQQNDFLNQNQNLNNFQFETQNLNSFEDQNQAQHFQFQTQNQNNFQFQTQNQNNFQFQTQNQNNFQSEPKNHKRFANLNQDQISFQSQTSNPFNLQNPNHNENKSQFESQNQNNFLNENQNHSNLQFQIQNQSNLLNQNQNKFVNITQNQQTFSSQNQDQSDFQFQSQNRSNFLNQNQDNNFQSQTQTPHNFLNQNDFLNHVQNQSNSQFHTRDQNNFLHQNRDDGKSQSPTQNWHNFVNQNQDPNHFQSQSQNLINFTSNNLGKALLQSLNQPNGTFGDYDSSFQNLDNGPLQNLQNVDLEQQDLKIGGLEIHSQENQSISSKFNKTGFQNPGKSIAEIPLNTDQISSGQNTFESSPPSHTFQNNLSFVTQGIPQVPNVQHNFEDKDNFFSQNIHGKFKSLDVEDTIDSDTQDPQTNFHSVETHSNFGLSNIHTNMDSNIHSKLVGTNAQSDSSTQTFQNNADPTDIHGINTQEHPTTFQTQVSNIGSNVSEFIFKSENPTRQTIQNNFNSGHDQSQFNPEHTTSSVMLQNTQDDSSSQFFQTSFNTNVQSLQNTQNIPNNLNSQHARNNLSLQNIPGNFDSQHIQSDSSLQNTFSSQTIKNNFESQNIPDSNTELSSDQNLGKTLSGSTHLGIEQSDSQNLREFDLEKLFTNESGSEVQENRDFPSQSLQFFDSELKHLQSGLFHPPVREFGHFQSGIKGNIDFQNHQRNSDSPTVPSNFNSPNFHNDFHPSNIENKQLMHNKFGSLSNQGNTEQQNLGKSLIGPTNLQNGSFQQQNLENSETGNLKGHKSGSQNLENFDSIHSLLNTQGVPDSPNIPSHFNPNIHSNPNLQTHHIMLTNNSESQSIQQNSRSQNIQSNVAAPVSHFNSQNLQSNQSIQGNINVQTSFESQIKGRALSESDFRESQESHNFSTEDSENPEDSDFTSLNLGNVDSELDYLRSGLFQPPLREFNHFQQKNSQNNFNFQAPSSSASRNVHNGFSSQNQSNFQLLNHQSNSESQSISGAFSSQNVQNNFDSQSISSNFARQNIRSNLESQNIQNNFESKNTHIILNPQNIQSNFNSPNIQGNFESQNIQGNFEAQALGKGFSELNNLQNNSSEEQKLKHSDTIQLENDNFSVKNRENTGSQLFIPGFFHSQNSNNHFDSHNTQAKSQNIQGTSDDQFEQNSFNSRFTSQNLGKSFSESKDFQNRLPESQNMENSNTSNLENNNFQSQNLENSHLQSQNLGNHFQSQNLENNNFQSQNREDRFQSQNQKNNNFQAETLGNVESEFSHLLSGRLQPPTRDFTYYESLGAQNNFDAQNFQNSFNPEYTQITLNSQKSQTDTEPQNRGKLLSDSSERKNLRDRTAGINLENTSSDELKNNDTISQNLEPPFREYNYFESQNPISGVLQNADFQNTSDKLFKGNLPSQNPRNEGFASQSHQTEDFATQNIKRSPSLSQNQRNGGFETHNQAKNDFQNANSETQKEHNNVPSPSPLNIHHKQQIMTAVDIRDPHTQKFENLERPRTSPNTRTRVQDEESHSLEPRPHELLSELETQEVQEGEISQLQNQPIHTTQQNLQIQVKGNRDNEAHILHENGTGLRNQKPIHTRSQTPFFNSFEPLRLQNGDNPKKSNGDGHSSTQSGTTDLQVNSEDTESVDLITQNVQNDFKPTTFQSSTHSDVSPRIQLNGHAFPPNMRHDPLSHAPSQPEVTAESSQISENDQFLPQSSQRDQVQLKPQTSQTDQFYPPSLHTQLQHNQRRQLQPQTPQNQRQAQRHQKIPFPLLDQQPEQSQAQGRESRESEAQISRPEPEGVKTGRIYFSRKTTQAKQFSGVDSSSGHVQSQNHTRESPNRQSQHHSRGPQHQKSQANSQSYEHLQMNSQPQTNFQSQHKQPQTSSQSQHKPQTSSQSQHKQPQTSSQSQHKPQTNS